ncbi:uncharacterized protein LOC114354439 isoform X2 [Ostrinia furnacalis]|uniref:uncharacterized protein LOC114354439 isoform X2 n=1 Tax=Ostrinia furnacalis TaxID=93504 RepID=UPI00103C058D|nr:uncharacterized protein LOC114354439 isoform X2 [Ostrinia furnacalis]
MGCFFSLVKTSIIFGTGLYAGVYIAQNYQIDKVEDPKVLFEKAQAFIKSKIGGDDGKKGGKDC